MKPPSESVLVEYTPIGVELLVEKYVGWIGDKGFAALPTPFIHALIQYPNSGIPIVRAINTSLLVMKSGRVIDGVGLDRPTGLFHRIDPVLRQSMPAGKPTEEDIKQSFRFLLDEWLRAVCA